MLHHIRKIDRLPRNVRILLITVLLAVLAASILFFQYFGATTFSGTLPCADCAGIKTTLILSGNHTYTLQSLYIDKGQPFTEKGTWQQESKNNMEVYVLRHGNTVSYYQIVNNTTLRMLDNLGNKITAPFSLDLKKE